MKKITGIILSLLFTINCFATGDQFAFDLFSKVNEKDNLVISPYSITSNLSLLAFGAEGATADELKKTLSIPENSQQFLHNYHRFLHRLTHPDQKGYKFSLANGLFPNVDFLLLPEFQEIARKNFQTTLETLDFSDNESARELINEWVAEKTNGKISQLLEPADVTRDSRFVFTNAIYFEGKWSAPFSEEMTSPVNFFFSKDDSRDVWMMQQTTLLPFYENKMVKCVTMPLISDADQPILDCVFILPNEVDGLKDVEKRLNWKTFNHYLDNSTPQRVELCIPKQSLSKKLVLDDTLKLLGIQTAFTTKADFSKIHTPQALKLDRVLHETYFSFTEAGISAAATTSSHLGITSIPSIDPIIPFIADHPFLFMVIDRETRTVLFMGRMNSPMEKNAN